MKRIIAFLCLLAPAALTACGGGNANNSTESAATNPPGDIPDTQAFVRYVSPGNFSVLVPEGWSRRQTGNAVTFVWNYNGERLMAAPAGAAAAALRAANPEMGSPKITHVTKNGIRAVLYSFSSKSAPNAVTNRSIALEDDAYVFTRGSRAAIVDLWAPSGSDNVDQWNKIAGSFRWK